MSADAVARAGAGAVRYPNLSESRRYRRAYAAGCAVCVADVVAVYCGFGRRRWDINCLRSAVLVGTGFEDQADTIRISAGFK